MFKLLKERLNVGEMSYLITIINGNRTGESVVYDATGALLYGEAIAGIDVHALKMNALQQIGKLECLVEPVEQNPHVLVLGAGHVSRAITDLLLFIGCDVTVVDDREEFVKPEFFDARVNRICLPMDKIKATLPLHKYKGFIVVTRAHEFDNVCLNQLRHELPKYIGVMGSKKRVWYALEHLREEGWSPEELEQLYAPIGLNIGGQTPEEIALSIVAEYMAVMNGKPGSPLRDKEVRHDA